MRKKGEKNKKCLIFFSTLLIFSYGTYLCKTLSFNLKIDKAEKFFLQTFVSIRKIFLSGEIKDEHFCFKQKNGF